MEKKKVFIATIIFTVVMVVGTVAWYLLKKDEVCSCAIPPQAIVHMGTIENEKKEVIKIIEAKYPELKEEEFKKNPAGANIYYNKTDAWRFAYITLGSGVEIANIKYFKIENNEPVLIKEALGLSGAAVTKEQTYFNEFMNYKDLKIK